jgi:hypothetical protein
MGRNVEYVIVRKFCSINGADALAAVGLNACRCQAQSTLQLSSNLNDYANGQKSRYSFLKDNTE